MGRSRLQIEPAELKQIRLDKGLSQRALAELIGLGKHGARTVRRYETGELNPSGPVIRLYQIISGRKINTPSKARI